VVMANTGACLATDVSVATISAMERMNASTVTTSVLAVS